MFIFGGFLLKKQKNQNLNSERHRHLNRVKTDTCFGKFRKVLEITTRHSTSMIPNDTQSQSEHSISQSY